MSRAAAVISVAALCGIVFMAGPGSVRLLVYPPGIRGTTVIPAWARPCGHEPTSPRHGQIAFCARVDGRVIESAASSRTEETHLLVVGGFRVTLVQLPRGARPPGWGSRITAVGAMFTNGSGVREVQAAWVGRT
jgi:hypothetical protein